MHVDVRAAPHTGRAPVVVALVAGALIAALVTVLLSQAPLVWTALLLAALLGVIPALVVADVRAYWLAVFLFLLLFDVKKTLSDGLRVMEVLGIDSVPTSSVLVPEIRASDFPFLILLWLWLVDVSRKRASIVLPRFSGVAAAYLGWAALSAISAPLAYLSVIELIRESKFFLIYLYAANTIRTKQLLRTVTAVLLIGLFVQGTMTLARYQFGFGFVSGLGRAGSDPETSGHLTIAADSASPLLGGEGARRSFGTVPSPRGTAQHLLLILPVALMLACAAPSVRKRAPLVLLFGLGLVALYVTFSRAALAGAVVALGLTFWFALRRQLISRRALQPLVIGAALAGILAAPIFYAYLSSRPDNVKVRSRQYDTALRMIQAHPILGVGLNNSFAVQKDYSVDASSQPLGDPTKAAYTQPIHSQYLALAVDTGVVGLSLYLSFFVLTWWAAMRRLLSPTQPVELLAAAMLVGISSLAIEFLADPCFEETVHALLWFYAGVLATYAVAPEPLRRLRAGNW